MAIDIETVLVPTNKLKAYLPTAIPTEVMAQTTTIGSFPTNSSQCSAPTLPIIAKGAIAGLSAATGILCAAVVVLVFLWRKAANRNRAPIEDQLPELQHPVRIQTSAIRAQELDTGEPIAGEMTSELDATPMDCTVPGTPMKGVAKATDK